MTNKTSYDILGVAQTATDDDIRIAYRKLAIKYHPDKNPGNPETADLFMEITAAYEMLKDSRTRQEYDSTLQNAHILKTQPARNATKGSSFDIADALRSFMAALKADSALRESMDAASQDPLRGANLTITVLLTLQEIALGVTKTIKINHLIPCSVCKSTGAIDGKPAFEKCRTCDGHGKLRVAKKNETVKCSKCQGDGKEIVNACKTCFGTGHVANLSSLSINFMPGIGEGNFLTLFGKGDAGFRGGSAGDLVVYIEEIPHVQFVRKGYDLETETTVPLLTAILGGHCMILTLDGETVTLHIPAGTQPETLFNLKNLGLPLYGSKNRGSLFVRIHVRIPEHLTKNEIELYTSLSLVNNNTSEAGTQRVDDNTSWIMRTVGEYTIINCGTGKFDTAVFARPDVVDCLSQKNSKIALDLSHVERVASMDIGTWIKTGRGLKNNNSKMFLIGPNEEVFDVIKETRMDAVFPIIEYPEG